MYISISMGVHIYHGVYRMDFMPAPKKFTPLADTKSTISLTRCSRVFEILSSQANWQIGRLAVSKCGMCSLGETCKGCIGSVMGTCSVPCGEHILPFNMFNNFQSSNLPICLGNLKFEKRQLCFSEY